MFSCNEHAHHSLRRESFREPSSVSLFGGGSASEQRRLACAMFRMQEADGDAVVIAPQRVAHEHYQWADRILCAEDGAAVAAALEGFSDDVARRALVLVDPACDAKLWRRARPHVVQCSGDMPELLPKVRYYALNCRARSEVRRRFAERIVGSQAPAGEFDDTMRQIGAASGAAYVWDTSWRWSYALRLPDEKSPPAAQPHR